MPSFHSLKSAAKPHRQYFDYVLDDGLLWGLGYTYKFSFHLLPPCMALHAMHIVETWHPRNTSGHVAYLGAPDWGQKSPSWLPGLKALCMDAADGAEGEDDGRLALWQRSRAPLLECFWQGRLIPGSRVESLPFIEVLHSSPLIVFEKAYAMVASIPPNISSRALAQMWV